MKVRDVAQPGSAHVWGAWGRKFKSCRPDKKAPIIIDRSFYFKASTCLLLFDKTEKQTVEYLVFGSE